MMQTFALILLRLPVNSRPVAPTLPAGHSGSVAGPVVLPVKIGPTLPAPWCCRRAALPAGCRRAARGAAGRSTPGRLPHAPGRSLGKRCRPVVLPVKIGPTLPARGAADVLRSRPVADVLPVVAPGRSLGKRCRPVVLPVKIGPTLPARGAADVLRSRPVADVLPVVLPAGQLPAGCPTLPAGHSGSVAGPWCCRSRSAPRSRPVVLPTCCAARPVADCACPWCCRQLGQAPGRVAHMLPGRSRRCRKRSSFPAPWCCRVASRSAPRSRPVVLPRAVLPVGCTAPMAAGPFSPHTRGFAGRIGTCSCVVLPSACAYRLCRS